MLVIFSMYLSNEISTVILISKWCTCIQKNVKIRKVHSIPPISWQFHPVLLDTRYSIIFIINNTCTVQPCLSVHLGIKCGCSDNGEIWKTEMNTSNWNIQITKICMRLQCTSIWWTQALYYPIHNTNEISI